MRPHLLLNVDSQIKLILHICKFIYDAIIIDKMSSEPFIPPTCYICLEECETTSPCKCETPVHRKCLWQYNRKSGAEKCTICRGEFKQVFNPCPYIARVIVTLIFSCVFYIIGGFLGELMWSMMGMCDCKHPESTPFIDIIFSPSFAISSLSVFAIVGICWLYCWRVRRYYS